MSIIGVPVSEPKTELERVAGHINDQFARMERAEKRAGDAQLAWSNAKATAVNARIEIGLDLIEARDLLEGEEQSFAAWLETNVRRSRRDCYACIKLAEIRGRYGCLTLATGAEIAIWNKRGEPKLLSANGDGEPFPHHQSRRVITALGLYRRASAEEREEIKRGIEDIDNG
jgi:hypothetical protein